MDKVRQIKGCTSLVIVLFCVHLYGQSAVKPVLCKGNSCCSSNNDPTPASVMISPIHNKNEWMFAYKYMIMDMKDILSGTQVVDKSSVFVNYLMSPDNMRMDMHMLMGMYGLTDKLTIMVMLNKSTMTMNMTTFTKSGHIHVGSTVGDTSGSHYMRTSGIGDIKLNVLYALVKTPSQQVVINAGLSAPTGSIQWAGASDDAMYSNRRYAYSMQLGSGTYDFLPAISYLFQRNKLTFNAQIASVIRTGYNSIGYKLGNETTVNTWLAYQWQPFLSSSVRFEGNMADKISGNDPTLYVYNELAASPSNYGGQRLSCAIGSVFKPRQGIFKNNRLAIEYALPVYQSLNGTQMKMNHTLVASWSIGF
jgi:hypothetical protein